MSKKKKCKKNKYYKKSQNKNKVSLVTFATYLLSNEANQLSVGKVLVSLALFDIMKLPLTIIPMLTVDIAEVKPAANESNGI